MSVSCRLERELRKRAAITMATPSHCRGLRRSPKRMMEKMTTNIGREALMVLTVVSGRCFIAISPDTQEAETSTALIRMQRWSCREIADRNGERKRVVRPVEPTRIQYTPFRLSACFLKTS